MYYKLMMLYYHFTCFSMGIQNDLSVAGNEGYPVLDLNTAGPPSRVNSALDKIFPSAANLVKTIISYSKPTGKPTAEDSGRPTTGPPRCWHETGFLRGPRTDAAVYRLVLAVDFKTAMRRSS